MHGGGDSAVPTAQPGTPNIGALAPTKTLLENFAQYFNSQAAGGEGAVLDLTNATSTKDFLVKESVAEAKRLAAKKDLFKASDVLVDESVALNEYFNAVAKITDRYFPEKPGDPSYTENEVTILFTIASKLATSSQETAGDLAVSLAKLTPYRNRYISATEDFKRVPVPPEAQTVHVGFVNSFANTALALEEIMAFERDPIIGVLGMQSYADEAARGKELLTDVKKIIQKNNIAFEKTDPAYEFTKNYLGTIKQ